MSWQFKRAVRKPFASTQAKLGKARKHRVQFTLEELDARIVPSFTWSYTGSGEGQAGNGANWLGGDAPSNGADIIIPAGTGSIYLGGISELDSLNIASGWKGTFDMSASALTISSASATSSINDATVLIGNGDLTIDTQLTLGGSDLFENGSGSPTSGAGNGSGSGSGSGSNGGGSYSGSGLVSVGYGVGSGLASGSGSGSGMGAFVVPSGETVTSKGPVVYNVNATIAGTFIMTNNIDGNGTSNATFNGSLTVNGGFLMQTSETFAPTPTLTTTGSFSISGPDAYFNETEGKAYLTGQAPTGDKNFTSASAMVMSGGELNLWGGTYFGPGDGLYIDAKSSMVIEQEPGASEGIGNEAAAIGGNVYSYGTINLGVPLKDYANVLNINGNVTASGTISLSISP
jgi:hypothetical protein